jgi:uncharacterized protein (DUF2235 family)
MSTPPRRLVVCLDGTWNNKDSSTNVLHHAATAFECVAGVNGAAATQRVFYHEGVGTGPLDRVTGGGFGFGLETNVRVGYSWLVQNYQEGDEVYVFGFSRGAHTARSLVGFIGMCGLLRRGAPLTVTQLWANYCLLGRLRDQRGGVWSTVFGEERPTCRRITDLVTDPWQGARQRSAPMNRTEELLMQCSRRIKIRYLGVYDTVGAVGLDALAIPGVRSRLALHHNLRPTTIVESCRHALAIDEHRSNFDHTPFVAYVGGHAGEDESARLKAGVKLDPKQAFDAWNARIEQRWFVGAHSNVGGGYEDNVLAQRPLAWVLEGAAAQGLSCEAIRSIACQELPEPRDSFTEFAKPIWTAVIRAKRNYRVMRPHPELRADRKQPDTGTAPGFALVSINETLDPSVLEYWTRPGRTAPPNLVAGAQRLLDFHAGSMGDGDALGILAKGTPRHSWVAGTYGAGLMLVLWAALAAAGMAALDQVFGLWQPNGPPIWWLAAVAAVFPLIDWADSAVSFSIAARSASPVRRAFLDSIYWTRALGVLLFVFGLVFLIVSAWSLGWNRVFSATPGDLENTALTYAGIALSAGAGFVAATLLDVALMRGRARVTTAIAAAATGAVVVVAAAALLTLLGYGTSYFFHHAQGSLTAIDVIPSGNGSDRSRSTGLLLLLQVGLVYFLNAFTWVGEPLQRVNLSGALAFQRRWSPAGVRAFLDRCRDMLSLTPGDGAATQAMTRAQRESLWRDICGFIPVYTLVFAFALWYGAHLLEWEWLGRTVADVPVWLAIPLLAALADYLEDAGQLRYLRLYEKGLSPSWALTLATFAMTLLKFVGFFTELMLAGVVVLAASYELFVNPSGIGWRGLLALFVTTATLLGVVGIGVWAVVYRLLSRQLSENRLLVSE